MSEENEPQREMTLDEWCGRLPDCHFVNTELNALKDKAKGLQATSTMAGEEIERLRELSESLRLDNCKKDAQLQKAKEGLRAIKYIANNENVLANGFSIIESTTDRTLKQMEVSDEEG